MESFCALCPIPQTQSKRIGPASANRDFILKPSLLSKHRDDVICQFAAAWGLMHVQSAREHLVSLGEGAIQVTK
jgi:hypothetical protein